MMKKILYSIGLLLLTMMYVSCDKNEEIEIIQDPQGEIEQGDGNGEDSLVVYMLPTTRSVELTTEQRAYVSKNNDFAFDFYRHFSNTDLHKTKSNIVSPLGLGFVMGMLLDGAQGKTRDEIASLIGFGNDSRSASNLFFKALIEGLPTVDENVTLLMSNMVAYDDMVMLEDDYSQNMASCFHADQHQLSFKKKNEATDYINLWSNSKTKGMISEIINENEIDETTILMLLNAIYFKATWAKKFDPAETHSELFHGTNGPTDLPMMHCSAQVLYTQNDLYSMVSLPYGSGDKWSMKVLLPTDGHSLEEIRDRLTNVKWKADCGQLSSYIVDIKLPRFKTETNAILNDILSDMGAKTLFLENEADFSPLTNNLKKSDGKSLWVGLLKQVATTEVNEEGTKLAAVTIAELMATSNVTTDTADFHCNRPFMYIIQEASSGVIFSIGTYHGN